MDVGYADTHGALATRGEERRQFQRHAYTDPVRLRNGTVVSGRAFDLSVLGVGVVVDAPFRPGTAIDVIFSDNAVFVEGVVRHSQPADGAYRVGIAFLQPEPELVEVLRLMRHSPADV